MSKNSPEMKSILTNKKKNYLKISHWAEDKLQPSFSSWQVPAFPMAGCPASHTSAAPPAFTRLGHRALVLGRPSPFPGSRFLPPLQASPSHLSRHSFIAASSEKPPGAQRAMSLLPLSTLSITSCTELAPTCLYFMQMFTCAFLASPGECIQPAHSQSPSTLQGMDV